MPDVPFVLNGRPFFMRKKREAVNVAEAVGNRILLRPLHDRHGQAVLRAKYLADRFRV